MNRNEASKLLTSGQTFLTYPGAETYLFFQQGFPMRELCAFEVFNDDGAWEALQADLLRPVADAAATAGAGLLTDCLVWRASSDYGRLLGYDDDALAAINHKAVERTREFVRGWQESSLAASETPVILSADLGPRGDAYTVGSDGVMAVEEARAYHDKQIRVLAAAGVDLVTATTISNLNEAEGIARAAELSGLPLVISPTIEVDGRLPDGTPLGEFIEAVDAGTHAYPLFYMVNCAHASHLEPTLARAAADDSFWLTRFRGFRTNASSKSHDELDNSEELDRGEPLALAMSVAELKRTYRLSVVGGCCGTDAEHLRAIANACAARLAA